MLPSDAALEHANLADLGAFITENPDRINELSAAVIRHPRGELTHMLERAAAACGYSYADHGWSKKPREADGPSIPADAEADQVDEDDLAGQLAEVTAAPARKKAPAADTKKPKATKARK